MIAHLNVKSESERGAMVVFVAIGIAVFLGIAAVAVDVGYIYKSRRELQVASDAGALAGARELATANLSAARTSAYQYATANKLAGGSVPMNKDTDVDFGRWSGTSFTPNGSPTNAIRVQLKKKTGTTQGPLTLLFGRALGMDKVQLQTQSIAILSAIDLVLTLDWSTSMVNGTTWTKCTKCLQGQTPASKGPNWCGTFNTTSNYCTCGTTTSGIKPFDTLQVAAASFVDDFDTNVDQIGVQLFESRATTPITQSLTSSFSSVTSKIAGIADPTTCSMSTHSTNIADGMAKGMAELNSARARMSAAKIMVLLSDGQPTCTMSGTCNTNASTTTSGRNSALAQADEAKAAKIVIHTIGLGPDVDTDLMQQIAAKTGGSYNFAATGNDLDQVFGDVRKRIPVQLVQ